MPEETLETIVRRKIHSFVMLEAEQFENIQQGKARTDEGYTPKLNALTDDLIKTIYAY